jgi:6-phosphogluconolactonase
MSAERHILADAEALARHAAEFVVTTLAATQDEARVCLSGGATPKRLYELLASPPFRDRLPWGRVHWFWGDERLVPPDHPASNYRLVRLAMLAAAPVPPGHVHRIPTEGGAAEAAARYEGELRGFAREGAPLFDVALLGLGEDGHTASLFPGSPALAERERWAVAVEGARVSLTFPALESARHAVFLVAGAGKHAILGRVLGGEDLPAARLRPVGRLHWMLDRAAATGEV